jgi:hypothetical protein
MTGTIGYEDIRAATVRQVAQLMAAAAITGSGLACAVAHKRDGPSYAP